MDHLVRKDPHVESIHNSDPQKKAAESLNGSGSGWCYKQFIVNCLVSYDVHEFHVTEYRTQNYNR